MQGEAGAISILIAGKRMNVCRDAQVDIGLIAALKITGIVGGENIQGYENQCKLIDEMAVRMKAIAAIADQLNTHREVS